MADLLGLAADPTAWVALVTLIIMEVVLGIDNLVFVSILSNRVAAEQRQTAQRVGLGMALLMRLALLLGLAWVISLTAAGLHSLRSRLLLEGPDPGRRRPVPRLQGHDRDARAH